MSDSVNNVEISDFHSLVFTVGNSKTAATYFVSRFGFRHIAFRGQETGYRHRAEHAVGNGKIVFILSSLLTGSIVTNDHVSSINVIVSKKPSVKPVPYLSERVTLNFFTTEEASTFFSERNHWNMLDDFFEPFSTQFEGVNLAFLDHVVMNYKDGQMKSICEFMEAEYGMHQFWSVDDKDICTDYSSLRSTVMASPNDKVKIPINEPAPGLGKSQIQEYLDHNGDYAGVQHIALRTMDIISTVRAMKARGVKFLTVPDTYYDDLRQRLSMSKCVIHEDMDVLQELNILVDFDDSGYLLQIFTESIDYRPTVFFEIIQRKNHEGFGKGNFLALFVALEKAQAKRGNLM